MRADVDKKEGEEKLGVEAGGGSGRSRPSAATDIFPFSLFSEFLTVLIESTNFLVCQLDRKLLVTMVSRMTSSEGRDGIKTVWRYLLRIRP